MTELSDTQRILLSSASQREGGSILPLPECLKPGGGTSKAIGALIERGYAQERETNEASAVHRVVGDVGYGVFIAAPGLATIGVEPEGGVGADITGMVKATPLPAAKTSKTAAVLDLLGRPGGATLAELIEATGWLPHTTRAALTGLRKKGHAIERGKRDDATCYAVVAG